MLPLGGGAVMGAAHTPHAARPGELGRRGLGGHLLVDGAPPGAGLGAGAGAGWADAAWGVGGGRLAAAARVCNDGVISLW